MKAITRFFGSEYFWYSFAALTVFVYLFGLTIPLLGPDEPRYAQVAREMFERGDWITPTLGGFHWFEKPALLYWLQIVSYNIFGVNEFAARLGSALFGLGTIGSLWLLGKKFAPEVSEVTDETSSDNPQSLGIGKFSTYLAMVAASTLGIVVFARGASFDIILTFPVTAACVGYFLFDHCCERESSGAEKGKTARQGPYIYLAAFYFFIGIALLAKGLVGIVFPFAIVAFYHVLRRLPSKRLIVSLFWGLPLAALVAASWYLPMYLTHGWAFIDEFFIQHHFQRYTSNKYRHPQPFYFFFWVLPLMTIPWLPFFFAGIWSSLRKLFYRRDTENQSNLDTKAVSESIELSKDNTNLKTNKDDQRASSSPLFRVSFSTLLTFSLAWLLVPLVFFSFSGSKLPGYILPSVPPAVVITGIFVWRFAMKGPLHDLLVKTIPLVLFAVVIALLLFVVPDFAEKDSVKTLIAEADERGYGNLKVAGAYTVSHNAEFYAPGRLVRETDGAQKRLFGQSSVAAQLKLAGDREMLLLVPVEWMREFESPKEIYAEKITDNGDLAIVLARLP